MKFIAFIFCVVMVWISASHGSEPLYPVALMNWMMEGTFHALIADKAQQRLNVWRIKDGEPALVESFRCSTGENSGDKWVRGDMKTPEGVYFFCSVIDGRTLPSKYGLWAFTTDYPNFVDRRRGKSGDGIWLHGRDKPLASKPDSNGCIALENQDLLKVSKYIRLQSTPLIVVDRTILAPRSVIIQQEREVRDFIESWRQAWESKNLENYMAHYSTNFQSCWMDYRGWKDKKQRLNKRYNSIKVKLGNIYLYRQDGLITSIFTQSYNSDNFRSSGIKVIYLTHSDKYGIFAEDYHQPVDDPYPVSVLLARAGVDPGPGGTEKNDFRIRLVSTDEPDPQGDSETPVPAAPSRGVVLERFVQQKEPAPVVIECNERHQGKPDERLLVCDNSSTAVAVADTEIYEAAVPNASRTRPAAEIPGRHPRETLVAWNLESQSPGVRKFSNKTDADNQNTKSINSCNNSNHKKSILEFMEKWKSSWEKKDLDTYMKMYHPDYRQGTMDYDGLLQTKRNFFLKYRIIKVQLDRVQIRKDKDVTHVIFIQSFHGDDYSDKGRKSMVLADDKDQGFRILSEKWTALSGSTANSGAKTAQ